MNRKSEIITLEQYEEIVRFMANGCAGHAPNLRVAVVLMIIADTGWSLTDVLAIRIEDVIQKYGDIQLVSKDELSYVAVSDLTKRYLSEYISLANIRSGRVFTISPRTVQKHIRYISKYLGYEDVAVQSFKKLHRAKAMFGSITKTSYIVKQDVHALGVPGIYSIRCLSTGKVYVGESDDIGARWLRHKHDLESNTHISKLMQSDYNEYGSKNFVWSILCECKDESERRELESLYIYSLGTIRYGYNTIA